MSPSAPRVVHFRGWPGSESWREPRRHEAHYPRLGDRVGLVLVAASELGAVPDRFGLGAYLVVSGRSILDAGLIVPDGLDGADLGQLEQWAKGRTIRSTSGPKPWSVVSISEFFHSRTGIFTARAYSGAGWCIGADLVRVFGLVAEYVVPRKGPKQDSWDLWLPGWGIRGVNGNVYRTSPHRPSLQIESRRVGGQVSFGPCRGTNGKRVGNAPWRGAFLDVLSLAYALDGDRGATFAEHRGHAGLEPVDLPVAVASDQAGAEAMASAVMAVHEFAVALDDQAGQWFTTARDRHEGRGRLDLARTVSPGGIATQVLSRLGVRAPHLTFGLSEAELHALAESFHGGWCEADRRLLGVPFPCVSLDVASCFPLAADLIGWWELVSAERVVRRKVTGALRRLCQKAIADPTLLLDPVVWRTFGCCLVTVTPGFEMFPIEVEDPRRPDGRLEFVPLSSPNRPFHFSAMDVLAAAVRSKKLPTIIEATAYVPEGSQDIPAQVPLLPGLVSGREQGPVGPMVEYRRKVKGHDPVTAAELRVVVNSIVFGNPSRMDEVWMKVDGTWTRGERPGPHVCLPLASSVSAGSHLLLAILERLVMDRGGAVAYKDTDSSLIPASPTGGVLSLPDGDTVDLLSWAGVEEIVQTFDTLSPDRVVWKSDRGEESTPMHSLVFGPKRHVQWVGATIADLTESDLGGTYVSPPTIPERAAEGYQLWSLVAVERERAYTLERLVDPHALRPWAPWDEGQYLPFPAFRRFMVKSPEMAQGLPLGLGARPGTRYLQAAGAVTGRSFGRTLVALDPGGDLSDWQDLAWVDKPTGQPVMVTTDPEEVDAVVLETLDDRAMQWSRPPRSEPIESVVIDPDLIARLGHVSGVSDAGADGLGVLAGRRPIYGDADRMRFVQREAKRLGYRLYARQSGLPVSVAKRAAMGLPLSPANVAKALSATPYAVTCAIVDCGLPVSRPNSRYCSKAHRDRAYRLKRRTTTLRPNTAFTDPVCPLCGVVLLGTAAAGPCPFCSTNTNPTREETPS